MNWNSPFIVYRLIEGNRLQVVHRAHDIKSAKYWLTYIAETGDILCKTPTHPKHSGIRPIPEYWSHKTGSGTTLSSIEKWQSDFAGRPVEFPTEDLVDPENESGQS